jgi:hypothetical protein
MTEPALDAVTERELNRRRVDAALVLNEQALRDCRP